MPIWMWQTYLEAGTTSGESLSLGGIDGEFPLYLQAVHAASGEIHFDLAVYNQSYGDSSGEFTFDLSTYATGRDDLPFYLAAFTIFDGSGENLHLDTYTVGCSLTSFSGDFMAAGYEYEDMSLFIEAITPEDLTDVTMDLQASSGIVETDMSMYLCTVGKAPVFQITYAHRLSSVKHEIT